MSASIRSIGILVISLMMIYGSSAQAQLLLDQTMSGSIGGATELGSAASRPASPEKIVQNLQRQGYTNIAASPTDPHQYTATNPNGMAFILTIEPKTGKILSALPQ